MGGQVLELEVDKALARGIEQGIEQGIERGVEQVYRNMRIRGIGCEEARALTGISDKQAQKVEDELGSV